MTEKKIMLKCPKHNKKFSLDDMKSSRCPYCNEWIDVFVLKILKSQHSNPEE